MLVSDNGHLNNYVIGNPDTTTLVEAHGYFQPASSALKRHHGEGRTTLVLHNVTHASTPAWMLDLVHADPAYRAAKASACEKAAQRARTVAAEAIEDAARLDTLAAQWRRTA